MLVERCISIMRQSAEHLTDDTLLLFCCLVASHLVLNIFGYFRPAIEHKRPRPIINKYINWRQALTVLAQPRSNRRIQLHLCYCPLLLVRLAIARYFETAVEEIFHV